MKKDGFRRFRSEFWVLCSEFLCLTCHLSPSHRFIKEFLCLEEIAAVSNAAGATAIFSCCWYCAGSSPCWQSFDSLRARARRLNHLTKPRRAFLNLRRDPDAAPDNDFGGYNFWLNKLTSFNGDYIKSEIVRSFILSTEYRGRFVNQ